MAETLENDRLLIDTVNSHLRRMLWFRRQYDSKRSFFYRQYIGQRDQRFFPDNLTPRSNTFVPYSLSNVETIVSRVSDAFFSFEPWFEVKGRGERDEPAASSMQLVAGYMLKKSGFVSAFESLVRNILIYGHGGMKIDWDWGSDMVVDPQPELLTMPATDPMTGQTVEIPVQDPETGAPIVKAIHPINRKIPKMCPKFIPIDVYDLLVDPDGGMAAHLIEKSWGQLKREAETKPELYYPEGLAELAQRLVIANPLSSKEALDIDSTIIRIAEFWNEHDDTCTVMVFGEDHDAIRWKDARAAFRSTSYSTYKRKVFGGKPILLWHGPNPFAHKKMPIIHTSYIKLPNEVYGLGAVEITSDLNEGLNRFTNMIVDNWNLGINRRYAYDTNMDIDHAALNNFNTPGGKVGVNGPVNTDVIRELPTHTPEAGDYNIIQLYKSMIEMASGVSDFYAKGVGGPSNNKTATGITSVINESNFRFKMFIRNLELDVLQPMLAMICSMIQQYTDDQLELQVTDAPPTIAKWPIVRPEELIGNFNFELVAANYASNKIIRQRNILAWVNWASATPYFNWAGAIPELAKIFEIRNIYKMLKPEAQVQQEQAQAMQSQAQLMLLEKLLETESKSIIAELSRKPGKEGETGVDEATKHALIVQKFIEQYLAETGGVPVEAPETGSPRKGKKSVGRPRTAQLEGKIPGAGNSSPVRDAAQASGGNAMGLEGVGDLGNMGGGG